MFKKKDEWYSNCLIEAVKAKIKWGKKVKVVFIPAKRNENYCPHFMWIDLAANNVKDFTASPYEEKWWNFFVFKGHIRCRPYAVYERWLKSGIWS